MKKRDGIILLFILGLLALFSLVTVTFVVVSRIHKRGSQYAAQAERTGDAPQLQLMQAALQVARGTNNPRSVIGPHSLLEDVYGSDGLTALIDDNNPPQHFRINGGQPTGLIDIALNPSQIFNHQGVAYTLNPVAGYYNGRVLTVASGPCAGASGRIVDYGLSGGTRFFRVHWPMGLQLPRANDRVVINGAPFNGTGFGLNRDHFAAFNPANDVLLDRSTTIAGLTIPWALLPNAAFYPRDESHPLWDADYFGAVANYNPAGPGGANEDYDAPDYQNMLLAMRIVNPTTGVNTVRMPSLHRPDLINYLVNQADVTDWRELSPDVLRRAMLRPIGMGHTNPDHPNFDGSNPTFDPVLGGTAPANLWDVDNDGDGVPDSVWVDIGLPVQTAPDGRTYKPLLAILCEDMDGKLNLNAHGNPNHIVQGLNGATVQAGINEMSTDTSALVIFADSSNPQTYPVGQGYGPAEVNLHALFDLAAAADYERMLTGQSVAPIAEGRYGELNAAMTGNPAAGRTLDGATSPSANTHAPLPARDTVNETPMERANLLAWLAHYWYPDDHFHMNTMLPYRRSSFSTPPDLDGDGILGIDPAGNMYYPRWVGTTQNFGMGEWGDKLNNPYQINLFDSPEQMRWSNTASGVVSVDAPYQATELERLLRFNDLDAATLPSRIGQLAETTFVTHGNAALHRHLITTESWDLPVPSVVPTSDMLNTNLGGPSLLSYPTVPGLHLADMIRTRYERDATRFGGDGAQAPTDASFSLRDLGMDLRRGLKFDLNRPFGNGIDDNNNGVVDEPGEAMLGETIWQGTFMDDSDPPVTATIAFDHTNSSNRSVGTPHTPTLADTLARQEYAKNLYVLMMLLIDQQFGVQGYSDITEPELERRRMLATQVAQWAVNVVDFRDADSIMTGFRFDILPFTDETGDGDPWDVSLDLSVASPPSGSGIHFGIVWGVERPELLLTETLAFHDRRTEDTDQDPTNQFADQSIPPDQREQHWDQVRVPQGSLFVELYNPWSRDEAVAGELYNQPGTPNAELDLARVTPPEGAPAGSPVWRLMITRNDRAPDRRDRNDVFNVADIERLVYFTDANLQTTDEPLTAVRHHTVQVIQGIQPGQYAVVGPNDLTDAGYPNGNRRFRLTSDLTDPMNPINTFATENGTGPIAPYATQLDPTNRTIQRVVAIPIDHVDGTPNRRLSVSEPTDGYPGNSDPDTGILDQVYDVPFDHPDERNDLLDPIDQQVLWSNSTMDEFRFVHLQRLANPLRPWHETTNPYLTIDTMPIDLTVYNSEDPDLSEENTDDTFLADNTADVIAMPDGRSITFASRQRVGGRNQVGVPIAGIDLWSQATERTGDVVFATGLPPDEAQPADSLAPRHTLGYLNEAFLIAGGGERTTAADNYNIDPNGTGFPYDYTGQPKARPFASFHWPNRPLINQYELLHVPNYSSAWLLAPHWIYEAGMAHYAAATPLTLTNVVPHKLWYDDLAFRHLIPWFLHSTPAPGGQGIAPHIYRLFEYVHVPTKFAGADEYLNPDKFQYGNHAVTPIHNQAASFHPPFNKVSKYREPGRVNINTIFDDGTTWQALTNDYPMAEPWPANAAKGFWTDHVARSRMGYAGFQLGQVNPASPTMFANPFRSSSGNLLVPLEELRHRNVDTGQPVRQGIESTLLRPSPVATNLPLLAATMPRHVSIDPTHNSYFQYQLLTKLGNNVTTRSNVYAVWITLGYFEVERVAVDDGHPDGWQLGRELGADSGEIKRHRAFFLIDRSIPVGFQRGEDLNVLDCFLIRRFIE